MKGAVFLVWLSILVASVLSNPVFQGVPAQNTATCQQNLCTNHNTIPVNNPQFTSQNIHKPVTSQSQSSNIFNSEGTFNQLLLSKILGNPNLQKILDPNTKLYNQNGQEIQRHINTAPNVINNYFIVPPEFFSLNNTKQQVKQNTSERKNKNKTKKTNHDRSKRPNIKSGNNDAVIVKEQNLKEPSNEEQIKSNERKQKKNQSTSKIKEVKSLMDTEDATDTGLKIKTTKKKIKKEPSKNKVRPITTPSSQVESEIQDIRLATTSNSDQNTSKKRTRKLKNKPKETGTTLSTNICDVDLSAIDSNYCENDRQKLKNEKSTQKNTQLRNIESPVDNRETSKHFAENRQTRNSKTTKTKVEDKPIQKFSSPDDMFRNLFPYMYYFYPNGNFPFNFDQIYQPFIGGNNKKNKKRKNKKNQNENGNKDSISNTVKESNKSPTNNEETSTPIVMTEINPEESHSRSDSSNLELKAQYTDISMDTPYEIIPSQSSEEEFEHVVPKKESVVTKANLQMPPTVIEDLHEFSNPDIDRVDMVPPINNNGLIRDYYPMFNDDSYYEYDDSYLFTDLDDARHFYSTDQGQEEQLNRDRRKYDKNEENRVSNPKNNDRVNFIRSNTLREQKKNINANEELITLKSKPYTHAKIIKQETVPVEVNDNKIQFQSPPFLENPDFSTKKIEIVPHSDLNRDNIQAPVYNDFMTENIPEKSKTYLDTLDHELNEMVNSDKNVNKYGQTERKLSSNKHSNKDHIETVFAKTKVIKYGITREGSDENTPTSLPEYDGENEKFHSDGHTTFVLAKSLGHVDDYYW